MKKLIGLVFFNLLIISILPAQTARWQQKVEYTMDIDMDVKTHQFTGKQKLVYYNNSPDTLNKVFYHLYFNAFQPGSSMDVRSRLLPDPDPRVRDRIFKLKEDEIGYQKINALKQDGKAVEYITEGTILEVTLAKPILPNTKSVFEMDFQAQVPIQIRRSGRNSAEGVDYSMAQWYPKICEYDYQGWHPNPYIAREFHGVWGDFEVKISIDAKYIIAGTGYLQNSQEIGYGYEDKAKPVKRPSTPKLTWHFKAPMVHDFVWAADPDYTHDMAQVPDGPTLHFFYLANENVTKNWKELPQYTIRAFEFMNKTFGKYPYKQYSVIQGGDGGMEYPMATLITGGRNLGALVGVTVHELIHSWFQGVLATNESLYAWMDEGFNSFAGDEFQGGDHTGSYNNYFNIVERGVEEALSTHADHFNLNSAYSMSAYSKGAVYLNQLGYVIGKENLMKGMLKYFDTWKFKHPNANDLLRVMEKTSGLELDWYNEYFVNSTHKIDYGIKSVGATEANTTVVILERIGRMPMPIDVEVTYKDGSKEVFYLPLDLMRGEKPQEGTVKRSVQADWPWAYPTYRLEIARPTSDIKVIEIDPSQRMADIQPENNLFPVGEDTTFKGKKKK